MRLSVSLVFTVLIARLSTCSPSPAVATERRCGYLASPRNFKWTQRAGNISGLAQHCAKTNCCMGYFRLERGKPTPDLLDCSCRRNLDFSPPVSRQDNNRGSPISNQDLMEQLISAQNSVSRQLATLSSQISEMRQQMTEQTSLIKGLARNSDERREHKENKRPAPKRIKRAHSVAIAEAARRLHNSVNNPQKYDPQTGISSPHNQAVTTHLLKEISKCFTDADPEMIKASCKTYYETLRRKYCLAQPEMAHRRDAVRVAARNRQRRRRLLEARSTTIQSEEERTLWRTATADLMSDEEDAVIDGRPVWKVVVYSIPTAQTHHATHQSIVRTTLGVCVALISATRTSPGTSKPTKLNTSKFRILQVQQCICKYCLTSLKSLQALNHLCESEKKMKRKFYAVSVCIDVSVLIIPAGALILLFSLVIILNWKILLKHYRSVKTPNAHDMLEVSNTDLSKHLEMQMEVACGRFASVWQGTLRGTSVAVKAFPRQLQKEFAKEKDVYKLPLMWHSGIVRFLEHGKMEKELVLVLELATQGSLNAFLSRTVCNWACTLKLAQTLSQGLAFLHTDLKMNGVYKPAVAHFDLSSSNVLVRADGSCALCDFGCAVVLQWQALQCYSAIVERRIQIGTLRYMSPEILDGSVNLSSGRCLLQGDVYSLGLLLWELLMRCSDLCKDSPVPEHMLPYEAELGRSPSLEALLSFVLENRLRPTIPHQWARVSQELPLRELIEDCWDHDADARLTAECAADRLASLTL